ncbi:MAG: hypothetical protein AB1782_06590 [Cyanobacteriota bacterium]
MKKYTSIIVIITIIILIICTGFFQIANAGDNIPSDKEVNYAKVLYSLMTDFDKKESQFVTDAQAVNQQDKYSMKNLFKNKFEYTKKYYANVMALQPTSKFIKPHQNLLVGIYDNLKYLQNFINDLDRGYSSQELQARNLTEFQKVNDKYSLAVKEIIDIIKSWQKPYIKKVMPETIQAG